MIHNPDSFGYDGDCLACHADQLTEETLDPEIPGFHQMKYESGAIALIPGDTDSEKCVHCHVWVDFTNNGSAAGLRRQTDAGTCAGCHSGGDDSIYQTP